MAGDIERVLGSIDSRLSAAERQSRAFRAPVLTNVDPEDIAEGVMWGRTDHGDGKGAPYLRVADLTHRVATDKQMITPVQTGTDPTWGNGQLWSRSDHGTAGVMYAQPGATKHRILTAESSGFVSAGVLNSEGTTSTGYTNLATSGPTVNVTTSGPYQDGLVFIECNIWSSQTTHWAYMTVQVSDAPSGGSYTFGPNDVFSARVKIGTAQADQYACRLFLFGFNPGGTTTDRTYSITAKYRTSVATNTAMFENRQLTVLML